MSELAFYRKYRSANFSEVIGQDHVVETLRAAINGGHISHAYLFTGPRGVGKTSVARLLARSVNCTGEDKPCGKCANCQIPLGSHLDLIEIDAASNRGIDEARDLRDKISLAPSMGKYKVYIIDEVHMLTKEAFNALLKTLEEPPPHAIFVLATTEAHKLPETIISRTQRFNFKPISTDDITKHLRDIASKESITIDDNALLAIARASHGGFRDAISMLDQVSSFNASNITLETVQRLLGMGDAEAIEQLTQAIGTHNVQRALSVVDALLKEGAQTGQIVSQLIERWREIMFTSVSTSTATQDETTKLVLQQMGTHQIVAVIEALIPVTKSPWPQLAFEAAIARLASIADSPQPAPAPIQAPKASPKPRVVTDVKPVEEPIPVTADSTDEPELWPKVLLTVKTKNNSLYALLRSCTMEIRGQEVVIVCQYSFHRDRLHENKNRVIIEQALEKVYGHKLHVVAQLAAPSRSADKADTKTELVSTALEILGGEIVNE